MQTQVSVFVFYFLIFFLQFPAYYGTRVAMKVVEEPSSFGVNNAYQDVSSSSSSLAVRVPPSNFSGPPHLHVLVGRCVSKVVNEYKYEVCPFQNVTQHEQSLRWNPYSGVLGVWQEWEIRNNTFVAMAMREGDSCGDVFRSVRVLLTCGVEPEPQISSVSEPSTCHYEVILNTSLVCHPHSMLVYPTLSPSLRMRWDDLEGKLAANILTPKGYETLLRKIFEDAGLVLSADKQAELRKQAAEKAKESVSLSSLTDDQLSNLESCKEEYAKLKKEIEDLKAILKQHGIEEPAAKSGKKEDDLHGDAAYGEADVDYRYMDHF